MHRRTLLIAGFVAATAVLAMTQPARADWTITAGLGQRAEPSRLIVVACHPASEELTLFSYYDRGAYAVRMRSGDSIWDRVHAGWSEEFGLIELKKVENCVGHFTIHYQKPN